ncbi:MAG: CoA transferase [Burkholderiaceae bacterium]
MKFLSPETIIVETIAQNTSPLIKRAIGFAGRLAADAGATVYTNSANFAGESDELVEFLLYGKQCGALCNADTHADAVFRLCDGAQRVQPHGPAVLVHPIPNGASAGVDTSVLSEMLVSELTVQAMAGICDLIGDPDREPLKLGGHQAAFAAGYAAYTALTGLIIKKSHFGQDDIARLDALSVLSWVNWKAVLLGGRNDKLTREGELAEWPVLPCADGHVAVVFTEADWPVLIQLIGIDQLKDPRYATFEGRAQHRCEYQQIIAGWVAQHGKHQLGEWFRQAGLPSGVIATVDDLLDDELLQHRSALTSFKMRNGQTAVRPVSPYRAQTLGAQSSGSVNLEKQTSAAVSESTDQPCLPLSGVRVLDLGIITAGAGTTALLADMGADVIKIESHTYPDPFRYWAGDSAKGSPMFRYTNRNKRGYAVDLKSDQGKRQFLELVSTCDVVLENFRRGVLDRLGFGFEALVQANPNIILASLTAQGLTGPGAENASFGSAIEARSGIASITGYRDDSPVISGRNLNYPDQIACLFGAGTVVAALHWQRQNGGGLHLDISQRDMAIYTLGDRIIQASVYPGQNRPLGNDDTYLPIQAICSTADGSWLAVTIDSEAITTCESRLGIKDKDQLLRWVARETAADAQESLRNAGAATVIVADGGEAFATDRQLGGTAVGDTPDGDIAKGFPFQYEQTPMTIRYNAPGVGEHNQQIDADQRSPAIR